jgi:hypothetical protein
MKRLVFPLLVLSLALILPALTGCPQEPEDKVPSNNQEDDASGNNPGGKENDADSGGNSGGQEDDDAPADIPSGNLGEGPLVLKGKVYTAAIDSEGFVLTPYTAPGVVEVVRHFGNEEDLGEGPLINGEFTISVTKKPPDLVNMSTDFSSWNSPKTDPADAQGAWVWLSLQDADPIVEIRQVEMNFSGDPANISGTFKFVKYLYVDKDVVITLGENKILEGLEGSLEMTYKAAVLELKKGWNALVQDMYMSGSGSPLSEIVDISLIDLTGSGNVTLSVGNPDFKQWIPLPVMGGEVEEGSAP